MSIFQNRRIDLKFIYIIHSLSIFGEMEQNSFVVYILYMVKKREKKFAKSDARAQARGANRPISICKRRSL